MKAFKTTLVAVLSTFIIIIGVLNILFILNVIELADIISSSSRLLAVAGIILAVVLGVSGVSLLTKDK